MNGDEIQALREALKKALAERDRLKSECEALLAKLAESYTREEVRIAIESRIAAWIAREVLEALSLAKRNDDP